MMNYRLCIENQILSTKKKKKVIRLEWANHKVRMSDDRTYRKYLGGIQTEEKSRKTKIKVAGLY